VGTRDRVPPAICALPDGHAGAGALHPVSGAFWHRTLVPAPFRFELN